MAKDEIKGNPCKIFFFDTTYGGFIDDASVLNGHIFYSPDKNNNYEFIASMPISYTEKSLLGSKVMPLYFVKWDEIIPVNFQIKEGITTTTLDKLKDTESTLSKMKISNIIKKRRQKAKEKKKDEFKIEEMQEGQPAIKQEEEQISFKTKSVVCVPVSMDMKFNGPTKLRNEIITPELLRSTLDMRFIKSMKDASLLSTKKRKLSSIAMIALFVVFVVVFLIFGLWQGGVLKF